MGTTFEGRVAWVFPDHFDVDLIVGVKNIRETNLEKLLPLCMASFDPDFCSTVRSGDILVAGRNFGYGHPHPQGMALMRKLGVWVVLGESFTPAFYRSEVANGMALLAVPGISANVKRFDRLRVEFATGSVENLDSGRKLVALAPPPMVVRLADKRGLLGFLRDELASG